MSVLLSKKNFFGILILMQICICSGFIIVEDPIKFIRFDNKFKKVRSAIIRNQDDEEPNDVVMEMIIFMPNSFCKVDSYATKELFQTFIKEYYYTVSAKKDFLTFDTLLIKYFIFDDAILNDGKKSLIEMQESLNKIKNFKSDYKFLMIVGDCAEPVWNFCKESSWFMPLFKYVILLNPFVSQKMHDDINKNFASLASKAVYNFYTKSDNKFVTFCKWLFSFENKRKIYPCFIVKEFKKEKSEKYGSFAKIKNVLININDTEGYDLFNVQEKDISLAIKAIPSIINALDVEFLTWPDLEVCISICSGSEDNVPANWLIKARNGYSFDDGILVFSKDLWTLDMSDKILSEFKKSVLDNEINKIYKNLK